MKRICAVFFSLLVFFNVFSIEVRADVNTDTEGPTVSDAFCDKQGQSLSPGDVVKFSFKAYDPSGLQDGVSVNFYEATSYGGRSFDWTYNSEEDVFETTFTVPQGLQNGEYYISTIYMYDIYGNQTAYSTHIGFNISDGISDVEGPTVSDAVCDKQGQSLSPGDEVRFSFKASDPSGLQDGVSVNFYEATSYKGRSFNWTYNSEEDVYETTFTVPEGLQNGEYYISTIYMYDIYGNQTAYSTHIGFNISDGISDVEGPIVSDAFCDKQGQSLSPGDEVKFSFRASDPSGLQDGVSVNFFEATSYGGRSFNWTYNSTDDLFETTYTIPDGITIGEYYISTIYMYDIYGNQTAYSTHLGYYIEGGVHRYKSSWDYDENNHWNECSICKDKTNVAEHTYNGDTCSVCGYVRDHVHSYSSDWISDASSHWHVCSGCSIKGSEALHSFDNYVCTVCGYRQPHDDSGNSGDSSGNNSGNESGSTDDNNSSSNSGNESGSTQSSTDNNTSGQSSVSGNSGDGRVETLNQIYDKITQASNTGTNSVVESTGGGTISYNIFEYLSQHPNITLDYKYKYGGIEYHVRIPGNAVILDKSILWYGPLWLAEHYGVSDNSSEKQSYTVKSGDTLSTIAKANNVSVEYLLKMNPTITNKNVIHIGQKIIL